MRRIVLTGTLAVLAAAGWHFARACAPDFWRAVFSYARHPDLPRTEFIYGRLGILQPTFARSYLVIAYRYLNGIGMNPGEREQARDFYKDRATGHWDHMETDWPARWRTLRSQIRIPPAPKFSLITGGQLSYDPETHSFALNCAEDAFRIAVQTLEDRRSRFGATSTAVHSWVGAQDLVFKNCDGQEASIPEEASTSLPPLIRTDRQYQIAAAHFYAGDYEVALDQFRRIGHDGSSPWNAISRYLVVRTLLRMTNPGTEKVPAVLPEALHVEADGILSDPALMSIHGMTWNLVERAGIRERDQSYFNELARLLSSKGQENGLREELWNYTGIYDGIIGDADPNAFFRASKPGPVDVSRFRDVDLSDWILSFQSRDTSLFGHSLSRWQETRSTAWLLAALSHTTATNARSIGLLEAAAAIPEASPAYLTARFHVLRMYIELGDYSAARDGLDALLSGGTLKNLPSSANLFRGLRMLTASNFEGFVHFALRKPVMVALNLNLGEAPDFFPEEHMKPPKAGDLFDADATHILNRKTPFRLLKEAALNEPLPPDLRREALMTAFTRGLMLGHDLSDIARRLQQTQPELACFTNGYLNAKGADSRRFAAALLLLHSPEARPYFGSGITRQSRPGRLNPYRDNWWCPMDIEMELDSRAKHEWYEETPNLLQESAAGAVPAFLTGDVAAESEREMEKLGTLSAAGDFLGGIVFRFAESNRRDPRIPEALYWLVRAGHYGCVDVNTWKTTRDAFRMLQLRYPRTSWAKRTPTWFKNDYDIRQEIKDRQAEN
jgi:hypothetical protein